MVYRVSELSERGPGRSMLAVPSRFYKSVVVTLLTLPTLPVTVSSRLPVVQVQVY